MTCSVQGSTLIGLIHNRNHFFCFGKTARACFWPTAGFRPQPKLALFISNSTVHQYYYSHKNPQNQTLSFECIEDNFAFLSHWAVPMMDHSYRSKNDLKVKKKREKRNLEKNLAVRWKPFQPFENPPFLLFTARWGHLKVLQRATGFDRWPKENCGHGRPDWVRPSEPISTLTFHQQ